MKWSHSYRAYKNAWHCLVCHPLMFLLILVTLRGINCKRVLEKMPLSDLIFSCCAVYYTKNSQTPPLLFRMHEWLKNGLSFSKRHRQTKKAEYCLPCNYYGKSWRLYYKMARMWVTWMESTQWCCLEWDYMPESAHYCELFFAMPSALAKFTKVKFTQNIIALRVYRKLFTYRFQSQMHAANVIFSCGQLRSCRHIA